MKICGVPQVQRRAGRFRTSELLALLRKELAQFSTSKTSRTRGSSPPTFGWAPAAQDSEPIPTHEPYYTRIPFPVQSRLQPRGHWALGMADVTCRTRRALTPL